MATKPSFVKSAGTSTPVRNSRLELEKMLTRYGCKGFAFASNPTTGEAKVEFVVPDTQDKDAVDVPVRFVVKPRDVYDALYGRPTRRVWEVDRWIDRHNPLGYDTKKLEQADRVAWRQLILWVDAALSVASSGMAGVAETFLAQTLIRGEDGKVKPMIQHLNETGEGFQKLLAAGTGA